MRVPIWSMPREIRASKYGAIAPRWCVMTFMVGSFSSMPENTMRAMHALVSYGQPNSHQISYFDFFSLK